MGQPNFTVFVDNVGTPHTFLKIDDGSGGIQYYGFAPSSAGSPHGPGSVGIGITTHAQGDPLNERAGYIDDVGWSKTIPVTSMQVDAMRTAVVEWNAAQHTYDGIAKFGGENCTTFVQFVARAGDITGIVTSGAVLPISLVPADERRALFTRDADGQRSLVDALKDPLHTPGTPAYEFKQSNPELFQPTVPGEPGKADQSTSELRENQNGSITEEIKQSDGDSQTNEYDANGVVTATTQTDGANDNSDYASRTTGYDTEGREDWRSTEHDNGARDQIDFDQKDERADSSVEIGTDAQGRDDWRVVSLDNGEAHHTHFDLDSSKSWSRYEQHFDAEGRYDYIESYLDDGSLRKTDFDQRNERLDSSVESGTDTLGRDDWRVATLDNGEAHHTHFDLDSSKPWSSYEQHFDAEGRYDYIESFLDDGSRSLTDFDQKNERFDRAIESFADAQGLSDWVRVDHDDGAVTLIDYDQKNERDDRLTQTGKDAQGRDDWQIVNLDNGQADHTNFDQDNTQSWNRFEQHFDAQGRQDYSTFYNDDGGRIGTNYDQNGTQPWDTMITTFTTAGNEWTDMAYDPGVTGPTGPPSLGNYFPEAPGLPFPVPPSGEESAWVITDHGSYREPRYDVDYGYF